MFLESSETGHRGLRAILAAESLAIPSSSAVMRVIGDSVFRIEQFPSRALLHDDSIYKSLSCPPGLPLILQKTPDRVFDGTKKKYAET